MHRVNSLRVAASCLLLSLLAPGIAGAQLLPCFHPVTLGVNGGDPGLVRSAHAGWMRVTLRWREVEPEPGRWQVERYDDVIDGARARGVQVLAILSTPPEWAGSNRNGTRPPVDLSLWEEFVRRVAAHYRGRIAAYEIWNEPDLVDEGLGVGWSLDHGTFPRYVDLLRSAAEAIRTEAPGTRVLGPVTSSRPNARTVELFTQLETTFPDGRHASEYLDAVSFHANALDRETPSEIQSRVGSQLATLHHRNPGNRDKPIWITELGWKSNRVGEEGQRQRIVSLLTNWSAGCDPNQPSHAFLFQERDLSGEESRGLFRADGSPKPIVSTYLAALPFPARTLDPLSPPFSALCAGGDCELEAEEWRANPFAAPVCAWDLGDGGQAQGCRVRHRYDSDEPRLVRLTVTFQGFTLVDGDGLIFPDSTCLDPEPPAVALMAPAAGDHLNGRVAVTAAAVDNLALAGVDFLVDGRVEGSAAAPPYLFSWDAGLDRNGERTLQLLARDRCGNLGLSPPVTVTVDRRRPEVRILSPLPGALLSGGQRVEVEAADDRGVAQVAFYVDRRRRGIDPDPPFRFGWNTARAVDGLHLLEVVAVDRAGNVTPSPGVVVRVDNTPPELHVNHPVHLQAVSGSAVRLSGWAVDGHGVASLSFEIDGRPLALQSPVEAVPRPSVCATFAALEDPRCPFVGWRTAFDSTLLADGLHTLAVTATDAAGVSARLQLTLVVTNGR